MTITHTKLDDDCEDYLIQRSQLQNFDLDDVFNSAYKFDEPFMQISKLQATVLQYFVATTKARTIIEIGTFVGFSAFCMAKAQESGRVISIEIDEDFNRQAKENQFYFLENYRLGKKKTLGTIEHLEFVIDDAKDYLGSTSVPRDIDIMFLDGDKVNYEFYVDWAIKNLPSGSHLLVDNALFKGGVIQGSGSYASGIRAGTDLLKASDAFDYFFLPVGDCMVVAKKR
jgi:predicted O-methyltransferase YrrM